MKEYLLLFRNEAAERDALSPSQLQESMMRWQEWISKIANNEQYKGGHPLTKEGRVVSGTAKKVTDAPFMEGKEVLGGYIMVVANNIDEATEMAKNCPILEGQTGSVEIREVGVMQAQ